MSNLKYLLVSLFVFFSCSQQPTVFTVETIVSPEDSGTVVPNIGEYNDGQQVLLTAIPNTTFEFESWSGSLSGSTDTITVIVNSDLEVIANFVKEKFNLTINIVGQGTVSKEIIKEATTSEHNNGTIIKLNATPESGWDFVQWSGDLLSNNNPKEITITGPNTITANFEKKGPFYLDDNGITIKAFPNERVGVKGIINGEEYTLVDNEVLKEMVRNEQDVTKVVTTLVDNLSGLFQSKQNFNEDISTWDTSNVTDMSWMFLFATTFNQNIGNWDTSNVTKMDWMFYQAYKFNQNIDNWNTSKVTTTRHMFGQAKEFNKSIASWDVSVVTDMGFMFTSCEKFNQNISNWNVSNVSNMNGMFIQTPNFNQDLTKWCVTNITSEPSRFSEDSALAESNKPLWGTCPAD